MQQVSSRRVLAGLVTMVGAMFGDIDVENADAQTTNSWINTASVSSKWEIGSNWSLGVPPAADTLTFITNGTGVVKTITIDADTVLSNGVNGCMTVSNLTMGGFGGPTTTLQLTNAGVAMPLRVLNNCNIGPFTKILVTNSVMRVEAGPFSFSSVSPGNLIVQNGGTLAVVGPWSVSNTQVLVVGGQLVVTNNPSLVGTGSGFIVDDSVTQFKGFITVSNVAMVVGNTGTGSFTQSGGGSLLVSNLNLGLFAGSQGTLTQAGGTNIITITGDLNVGFGANTTGTLWLTGSFLAVTNPALALIGRNGSGAMILSNGNASFAGDLSVGASGGSGTLTVAGGTNTISGFLIVGSAFSTGTVWLTGGRIVAKSATTINDEMTTSNGTFITTAVHVGDSADNSGVLRIAGGTNEFSNAFTLGDAANSTGAVWVTGGLLTVTNNVTAVGQQGPGELTVSNGTTQLGSVFVGRNIGALGTLTVADGTNSIYSGLTLGTFACNATGTVIVAGGRLFVTNSTGNALLEVRSGSLLLNSGTLVVDQLVLTNPCASFVRTGGTLSYSNVVLNAGDDTDADGISNGYEQSHGLDPLNSADANIDSDGDGFTNLQEFQAGTDATNNASAFRITAIVRTNNDMRVTWMTGPGKTNALQATAGGAGGSYSTNDFVDIFAVTNAIGGVTNHLDVGAATNAPARYYRVRLVP